MDELWLMNINFIRKIWKKDITWENEA